MKTLLVILAHPDDESFGPGGTLAKYAHAGVAVHYVCGTRGESGTVDAEKLNGFKDVAELRTSELMCAAQHLKLTGVHFLGYRDSGMVGSGDNALPGSLHAAPLDEAAQRIIAFIEQLNPDAILTHDQYGGYGHPDHIKLHQATVRAYALKYGVALTYGADELMQTDSSYTNAGAAKIPRLYFTTIPKPLIKFGVRVMPLLRQDPRKFGRNKDIDLVKISQWEVPVTCEINVKAYAPAKDLASACHASQQSPQQMNPIIRFMFRRASGKDFFARAFPPAQKSAAKETGFFEDSDK